MAFLTFLLAVLAVGCVSGRSFDNPKADCSIAINGGLPEPQPLVLRVGGSQDGFGFALPIDASGLVHVTEGDSIRIACAGNTNFLVAFGAGVKDVEAVCVGGSDFMINGGVYNFMELACNSYPFHTARYTLTGDTCFDGAARMIEVGFDFGTEFFRVLDICFDDVLMNTLWSRFDLVSGIGGYQSGFPRPGFIADNFYPGLNVDNLYTRVVQRQTISTILNSAALGDFYVHETDDVFMARGHLTAKADFVYGSQHRATFHFVNVAPQWQSFNGGNWGEAEFNVRQLADARKWDLDVYTGTYGVLTLADEDGVHHEIYLHHDANNNHALPVPKLFWKVVYNPISQQAVALFGVNNPHEANPGSDPAYVVCDDVCSQINWLTWNQFDIYLGYSYCCEVNDQVRAALPFLPDFPVSGLLV